MSVSPEPATVVELLGAAAARAPGATSLVAPARRPLTYAELLEQVGRTAGALRAAGAARDDVVALVADNGPEAATAFLALAGAAVVRSAEPGLPRGRARLLSRRPRRAARRRRARHLEPRARGGASRGIDVLELEPDASAGAGAFDLDGTDAPPARRAPRPAPDDVALMLHTSGTTSRPKLVPLTQRNLGASARERRRDAGAHAQATAAST